MSISLTNSSSYLGKKGKTDWWSWNAYIECQPPDSLDVITFVEYQLHPSFPNPIRRIRKKQGGFPLETRGWGIFKLRARVVFEDDSREPMILTHMLEFK